MLEVKGNFWEIYGNYEAIVVTTNGMIRSDGKAVMGKGIALQFKEKFIGIDQMLAIKLRENGNVVSDLGRFGFIHLLSFPTKHNWRDKSDIKLIEQSCQQLLDYVNENRITSLLMTRPGCGNGGLDWKDVKPILEKYFDDRFTVIYS